jgi:hypothetical protein
MSEKGEPMATREKQIAGPAIPSELWMLLDAGNGPRNWVKATDGLGGLAESYLVAFTEAEAQAAAEHQNEMYYMDCRPVRVK